MQRGLVVTLLLLLFFLPLLAQDVGGEPELVDEIGMVEAEDWEARIDIFCVKLQNDPSVTGLIRTYGPAGTGVGTADRFGKNIKHIMVTEKNIDAERIKILNGGRFEKLDETLTEFWLISDESKLPPDRKIFVSPVSTFKGKIGERSVGEFFGGVCCAPGVHPGNSISAGVADVMTVQTGTRLYLVIRDAMYNIPGRWERIVNRKIRDLESYGIANSRIETIYAGKRTKADTAENESDELKIAFWILAEGDAAPIAAVKPAEPKPESFDLGDFYEVPAKCEEDELLLAISDTLKAFPSFTVSFVVRKPGGAERSVDDTEKAVLGLPEHLKELLLAKGISPNRIKQSAIPSGKNDPIIVHIVLHPKGESPLSTLDI